MTLNVVYRYGNTFLRKREVHLALSTLLCFHATLETTGLFFLLFIYFVSAFIRYRKSNDLTHLCFL